MRLRAFGNRCPHDAGKLHRNASKCQAVSTLERVKKPSDQEIFLIGWFFLRKMMPKLLYLSVESSETVCSSEDDAAV